MGTSNPSLRQVAKTANVSVGTVSNFLNNPEKVTEKTRKIVQDAIDKTGFTRQQPHVQSHSDSKIIGFILPLSGNPFYDEIAQGLEDAVGAHGYKVLIGYSREDSHVESGLVASMIDANFRAIVLSAIELSPESVASYSDKIHLAFISQANFRINQCSVTVDQISAGYLGLQYLHSLGHKKIMWIGGPASNQHSNERFLGINQAAQEFGIELETINLPSLDFLAGEYIAPQILAQGPLPDAIFCANDITALGLMNHFYKSGINIPSDVSVLGFDNITYGESSLVPLTTVSQSPYKLGFMTGNQLIDHFDAGDDHIHHHVLIEPEIIERSSTRIRQ